MSPRDLYTYRIPGGEPEVVRELKEQREEGERRTAEGASTDIRSDHESRPNQPEQQTRPEDQVDA